MSPTCASCGGDLVPGGMFCPSCGASVRASPGASDATSNARSEERRVVSVLFVDLVGFTARSDRADPEDVRRTLVPFHARVKEDLERFGGTLDKFIGDAVMGVFGAPIAHEDDAARAVRSGLSILRTLDDLRRTDPELAARVAIETGEAVVAFGTGPQIGEAVAGDVVNTASRMQALAPPNSVVVGASTLRAVRDLFDVEALPPSIVKGKAQPLRAWRILAERRRSRADVSPTAFVGRASELGALEDALARASTTSSAQLLTVVGDPGIGKSRLLGEFRRRAGSATRWLSGRCLPYGDMVTFAPVAATIQQVARIDPADNADEAHAKLSAAVSAIELDAAERRWLLSRLEPIVGAAGSSTSGPEADDTISPSEIARAWARAVLPASAPGPLVLELDDLHWADRALLDVIEHLLDDVDRRPMLLLCSARPEFLERHAGWGGQRSDATTVVLAPLPDAETDELLTDLLARAALSPAARAALLERTGGNPLYALEFARMLADRSTREAAEVAMPETVQAVIAARLDAVPSELRAVVQDASVSSGAFWPGLLAWLGGRSGEDIAPAVLELVRRGLALRMASSTFDDEEEFDFTHALVREVAYARMPRAQRARLHCSAGTWIERASRDRVEERADMLARHFATAVELAQAAGERDVAELALGSALRWLMASGERAARLDAGAAFALYDRAVSLAPADSPERARALLLSAQMGRRSGRIDGREVLSRYEEALAVSRAIEDPVAVGVALTRLGSQAGAIGDVARSRALLAEAVSVLEEQRAERELARAYAFRAEEEMFAGRVRESLEFVNRALDLLGDGQPDDLVVMCLHIRGDGRCSTGDPRGIGDLEEALRLSIAIGTASDIVTSENYLGEWLSLTQSPAAALAHYDSALALAERRGVVNQGQWTSAAALGPLFDVGEWDRALAECERLLAYGRDRLDASLFAISRAVRSRIMLLRGRRDDADDPEVLLGLARPIEEMHSLVPALVTAAELWLADGDRDAAAGAVEEFAAVTREAAAEYRESQLAPVARICVGVGRAEIAADLVAQGDGVALRGRLNVLSARALVAEASGQRDAASVAHATAAEEWRSFGSPYEQAQSLLGVARCLPSDERDRAAAERARAATLLRSLGARPPSG